MQGTLFVTILFTLCWTIGGAADLSDLPETEVAVVGSDVSLKCTGNNSGELRWTKYKTFRDSEVPDVVNYGSNVRNEFATRYTVKHEFDEYILNITGAIVEDTGRFVCGDSAKVDRDEIMLLVIDSSCSVESTFAETFSALPGQPNSSDIVCTLKYTRTEPPTGIRCSFSQHRDVNFSHPTIFDDYATYTSRVQATCSSIADVPLTCFGNFTVAGRNQTYSIAAKWNTTLICSHWRWTIFIIGGCLAVLLLTFLFICTAISVRRCAKVTVKDSTYTQLAVHSTLHVAGRSNMATEAADHAYAELASPPTAVVALNAAPGDNPHSVEVVEVVHTTRF